MKIRVQVNREPAVTTVIERAFSSRFIVGSQPTVSAFVRFPDIRGIIARGEAAEPALIPANSANASSALMTAD